MRWGAETVQSGKSPIELSENIGTVQSGKSPIELSENIPNPFSINTEISTRHISLFARSRQPPSFAYNHLLQYNYPLSYLLNLIPNKLSTPVAPRYKAWVCGRSHAETESSNPSGALMSASCQCCVLSGRGLSDGPIPCQEESYRLWCVVVCGLETSRMRTPWHALTEAPHE